MKPPLREPDEAATIGRYRYEAYRSHNPAPHVKVWIWKSGKLLRHWKTTGPRDRLRSHYTFGELEDVRMGLMRRLRHERVPSEGAWSPKEHPCHEREQRLREKWREKMRQMWDVDTERANGTTRNRLKRA